MDKQLFKKFIRSASGELLNIDYIVTIDDYYGNYLFKMADGEIYEVYNTDETKALIEYLSNQTIKQ